MNLTTSSCELMQSDYDDPITYIFPFHTLVPAYPTDLLDTSCIVSSLHSMAFVRTALLYDLYLYPISVLQAKGFYPRYHYPTLVHALAPLHCIVNHTPSHFFGRRITHTHYLHIIFPTLARH